ncbi:hypothetical protein BU17DRAFT_82648 [Hysterangium stoloniferum]|nr:hypothetical protein BU17DRAFT_82648 [Hysterangium stoloniferum]
MRLNFSRRRTPRIPFSESSSKKKRLEETNIGRLRITIEPFENMYMGQGLFMDNGFFANMTPMHPLPSGSREGCMHLRSENAVQQPPPCGTSAGSSTGSSQVFIEYEGRTRVVTQHALQQLSLLSFYELITKSFGLLTQQNASKEIIEFDVPRGGLPSFVRYIPVRMFVRWLGAADGEYQEVAEGNISWQQLVPAIERIKIVL